MAVLIVVCFQMIFTYTPPFQALFQTRGVPAGDWAVILLVASSVLLLVEAEKWIGRRWLQRGGRAPAADGACSRPGHAA